MGRGCGGGGGGGEVRVGGEARREGGRTGDMLIGWWCVCDRM